MTEAIGNLGVNILAYEIINVSLNLDRDISIDYFAANISLGVDYLGLKYNYSLQNKIKSGYMIPGTFNNGFSFQPNQYINLDGFSNNSMNLTFSFGIGIVLSITI